MRIYQLSTAALYVNEESICTILADGSENFLYPPVDDPAYIAAANEMGYSCPFRYGVEHELAHHVLAGARGLGKETVVPLQTSRGLEPTSRIIYRACHSLPMSMDEEVSANEEHLVNRLQRYANLGEPDSWGHLERELGADLPTVARKLIMLARPWLEAKKSEWPTNGPRYPVSPLFVEHRMGFETNNQPICSSIEPSQIDEKP